MSWLRLVVGVLALHRAARLVTADTLTMPLRERLIRWAYLRADLGIQEEVLRVGEGLTAMVAADIEQEGSEDGLARVPRLAVLVVCRWCASVWLSAAALALWWAWQPAAVALGLVLAGSSAATLLARLEDG